MTDILQEIEAYKREEIAAARRAVPPGEMDTLARAAAPPRGFLDAIRGRTEGGKIALIAEVKRASPSKGLIRKNFDPEAIAKAYERGGATCLSVLTDGPSFQGSAAFLRRARDATSLPVLRKDFMYEPYQVAEARAMGADCILIILAAVDLGSARELMASARSFGMDSLVEVHDRREFDLALELDAPLLGINNRSLKTFVTRLGVTEELAPLAPAGPVLVTESGIGTHADVTRLKKCGVGAFLVGESLMRQSDVETATRHLLGGADPQPKPVSHV